MATGNAQSTDAKIVKVGHTYSDVFGSEPMAKVRGRDTKPTDETFSGSGGTGVNG